MRKTSILLFFIFFSVVLNSIIFLNPKGVLERADKKIVIDNIDQISENILLPKRKDFVSISWESDNNRYITEKGYVIRPANGEGNKEVTLTATLSYFGQQIKKEYEVTLLEQETLIFPAPLNYDFENISSEYDVDDNYLDLYYSNNSNIPYVDVNSFLLLLEGAIDPSLYEVETAQDVLTINVDLDDEIYTGVFNFEENTFSVNCFDFFDSYSNDTETNFGEGLSVVDYAYTEPNTYVIDIGDYGFELVCGNELYLIPFSIANLFLSGSMYDVYFDEDRLYGVDTYQVANNTEEIRQMKYSIKNLEEIPYDLKIANYSFLALSMDHFYGLKGEIDTYYDILIKYQDELLFGNDKQVYKAIHDFTINLDEMHSWPISSGYYESPYEIDFSYYDLEERYRTYIDSYWEIESFYSDKQYLEIIDNGKTAIIYIEEFDEYTPILFESLIDTIIETEGIQNVVLDIANNGGGILGTMIQILGFMTDEDIVIYGKNTKDLQEFSLSYESDNDFLDVNWYILSSNVTYSAANLLVSIAKDMNIATVIGETSGGGASSVRLLLLPSGSIIQISSTTVMTNDQHESIEFGIEADIIMNDLTDKEEIISIINR